jgi:hypothetical protein
MLTKVRPDGDGQSAMRSWSYSVGYFASELPAISREGKKTNMKLTRWMKTTFADALSSSAATQVEVQEPTKRESVRILNGILTLIIVGLLIAPIASPRAAGAAKPAPGPTAESVMAAEEELTRALRDNDADGIARCLSDDWAVISARCSVGEGSRSSPKG